MTVVTTYVPPFATAAPTAGSGGGSNAGTGISFASIASRTAGTGTATSSAVIVDSTGGVDSSSLLEYFTKPYIDAHSLSIPSYRYAYILWFVIAGTLILWSIAYHLSGTGTGGSSLGAWFRKWSIRRITWTKRVGAASANESGPGHETARGTQTTRKKVVWASPTFAQTITVLVLIASALCLTFIGPDYIAPTTCTFGGYCGYQSYYGSSGPPKSTYRTKRDISPFVPSSFAFDLDQTAPAPLQAGFPCQESSSQVKTKPVKRGPLNPNGWAPFNDPLLASSNRNIDKSAWTTAARLGLISFAMLPLAVTLAVKQWPFNIWATPWLTNYHFDKTAILHRWSGRVIWAFSTAHAIAWFYQLYLDKDPFGRPVLIPVWDWYRFTAGAVAWVLLTLITFLSLSPLRNRYYEAFYWSHVVLLLLFFAAAILHHRPVMYFPIAAAAWWGGERLVRFVVFLWINGFARGIWFKDPARTAQRSSSQSFGMLNAEKLHDYDEAKHSAYPPVPYSEHSDPFATRTSQSRQSSFATLYPPAPSGSPRISSTHAAPPAGFAAAQLLPGRTIRLTLRTPETLRWAPGQHLLLNIPSVRLLDSHPYTIASIDHRAKGIAPVGTGSAQSLERGSDIILLVRAQNGFSKALWNHVVKIRRERELQGASTSELAQGVNLRSLVSWPMGSAARVEWGAYDSLNIIAGGTGITFGVSVLEYACTRIARKQHDPKWKTNRVRFVWILKEFAHLSWVASTLRRCMEMCDPSQLQIELYVTNDTPRSFRRRPSAQPLAAFDSTDELAPPTAPFARQGRGQSPSRDSLASEASDWSDAEDSPRSGPISRMPEFGEDVDSVTDLVLFEGEEEERTQAEVAVSAKLKKEGKLRRALSRRQGKPSVVPNQPSYRHDNQSTQRLYESPQPQDSFEALPLDEHESSPNLHAPPAASRSASYSDSDYRKHSLAHHYDDQSEVHTLGDNLSTRHLFAGRYERDSVPDFARGAASSRTSEEQAFFLDVTEAEQQDLEAIAELARPGYPRLKQILDDEVNRSSGKTIVACCGPSSLNTLVRNLVSSRIDLKRVAKGDVRGQVSIVVEDFSF
ncbi:ferric reductase family protein [Sporobolomyces koalae]|uniref:ferric reductase family protein n=1 Tax=Sporobolomyces koalae TaxID=500713 RepID=UPI00317CC241